MKRAIKIRFILLCCLLMMLSFIALSWFNYRTAREAVHRELAHSSIPLLRENIYSEIQQEILPAIRVASVMANDSFLIQWATSGEQPVEEITRYLQRIKEEYSYYSSFFISADTSLYYHAQGIHKRIDPSNAHDVWYYDFVASQKEYDLDVDTDEVGNYALTIFINYRVEDEKGRFLGVTGVGLRMESFSQMLQDKQESYNRNIYLVDSNGIIQAHSDMKMVERYSSVHGNVLNEELSPLLVESIEPINMVYPSQEGRMLISSRYISEIDWFLIVEQDEEQAMVSARRNLFRTLLVGAIITIILIVLISILFQYFTKEMERIAISDPLTKLPNRRELDERLKRSYSRFSRGIVPLSLIVFDIDFFKNINDSYGHDQGDKVLCFFASLAEKQKRPHDLLARWGGDEFVMLVESHEEEAAFLVERIFKRIQVEIPGSGIPSFSISAGVAELIQGEAPKDLLNKADKALYQAKSKGRDRFVRYTRMST